MVYSYLLPFCIQTQTDWFFQWFLKIIFTHINIAELKQVEEKNNPVHYSAELSAEF